MRALLLVVIAFSLACKEDKPTKPPVDQAERAASKTEDDDGSIKSVYPANAVPDPVAQAICEAFQSVPRTRKAECCERPVGLLLTGECTRVVSGAMADKSLIVDADKASACVAAVRESFEGCDWVGAWSRDAPAACAGIVEGQLDDGATCRSSLECKTGLTCHGVSPTDTGTCGQPGKAGSVCGRGIDPLSSYLGKAAASAHPMCEGFCANSRCRSLAKLNEKCVSDQHCGDGNHCEKSASGKVCKAGAPTSRPPPAGELPERCAMLR